MLELDIETWEVRLCNAACPYPYHFRSAEGTLEEIEINAYPLGVRLDTHYTEVRLKLLPGDYLFLGSDGIAETEDATGGQFGYEQTRQAIYQACIQKKTANEAVEHVLEFTKQFRGVSPQADDMTLVVLRRHSV
jgi:phosphoserine phosphatase RsbU/P